MNTPKQDNAHAQRGASLVASTGGFDISSAPKDGTELALLIRHPNYGVAPQEERDQWEEWCAARWIEHNGGGWTWRGISGSPVAWKPVEQMERSIIAQMFPDSRGKLVGVAGYTNSSNAEVRHD